MTGVLIKREVGTQRQICRREDNVNTHRDKMAIFWRDESKSQGMPKIAAQPEHFFLRQRKDSPSTNFKGGIILLTLILDI